MTLTPPFFMNVLLLNKDEVVANTLESKTGLRQNLLFGRAAAFAANKLVSDEKVITNLAATLIDKITVAITEMGITAQIAKKFQKGPLVVIKVQITEIDKLKLIRVAKGQEFCDHFNQLLTSIAGLGLGDSVLPTIDEKISVQVHDAMMQKFEAIVPQKMAEAGVHVECAVNSTEKQAEYFFDAIASVN